MANQKIDHSKAKAKKKFQFTPFLPTNAIPLKSSNLRPAEDILVFTRIGKRYALILRQMVYHHVAQGTIEGEPYIVSF
ncbi:MAG: hypothetical protein J7K66_04665 [Anaerolineaceae bacterium]|nr:hypothetical protein [Anaerolineaceae bacterium]